VGKLSLKQKFFFRTAQFNVLQWRDMAYLKKALTPEILDTLRINLSVREKKISHDPVCDFCGNPKPIWVYAADRMSTGAIQRAWRWTACAFCSRFIDKDDWTAVRGRVANRTLRLLRAFPVAHIHLLAHQAAEEALREFYSYAVRTED
jgi:hypothetical protein